MKPLANAINITMLMLLAQFVQAASQTIDDFNTGPYQGASLVSESELYIQKGSMLGGQRHVVHRVDQINPSLSRTGRSAITKGHLIVEDGVHAASRLQVSYGIEQHGSVAPLNLDLSQDLANGQFTLHFHSIDMQNQVDVIIQAVTSSREVFQISKQVTPPVVGSSFDVSFPLADFRSGKTGKPPTENDFKSIDYLVLIFQEGGNGGNDFAVDSFDIR